MGENMISTNLNELEDELHLIHREVRNIMRMGLYISLYNSIITPGIQLKKELSNIIIIWIKRE